MDPRSLFSVDVPRADASFSRASRRRRSPTACSSFAKADETRVAHRTAAGPATRASPAARSRRQRRHHGHDRHRDEHGRQAPRVGVDQRARRRLAAAHRRPGGAPRAARARGSGDHAGARPADVRDRDGFIEATADLGAEARAAAAKRVIERASAGGQERRRPVRRRFSRGERRRARDRDEPAGCSRITARPTRASRPRRARPTAPARAGHRPVRATGRSSIPRRSARAPRRRRWRRGTRSRSSPGMYTVVLEPQAVADLVPLLRGAFNARAADEGRGPFSQARRRHASSARRSPTSA